MRHDERKKQIALVIAIILVIIIGTSIFHNTRKDNDKSEEISQSIEETANTVESIEDKRLYYIEEFRGEESFVNIQHIWIMTFKDKPVRISKNPENQKMSLMDMETGDYIYEFPKEEMYDYDGLWIDKENIFWTIKYQNDLKQTIVKAFDEYGQETTPPIVLENFKGAEGFDEVEDKDLYLDIRNMRVDDKNLYFGGYALERQDESFFQAYTKEGILLKTFLGCNKGLELDKDGKLFLGTEGKTYLRDEKSGAPDLYDSYYIKFDGNTFENIYQKHTDIVSDISYNSSKDRVYVLYAFGEGKIIAYDGESGERLEDIFIFGEDSSYITSDPTSWIWDFYVGENEEIYLALRSVDMEDGNKYKFLAYRKKARRDNIKKRVTLTITAPYKDDFLVNAIKAYELKYPEEKVDYNYKYNNNEQFLSHRQQYAEQLARDILTGEIGDVIAMGAVGLVYDDVFRSDAFEDLIPYLEKDPSYNQLNKNVMEGIKVDDAIRALPVSYSYYFNEISEELVNKLGLHVDYDDLKWSDVLKWTKVIEKKAPDSHLFIGKDAKKVVLNEILMSNIPDLIDLNKKKADLNQEWFVDLMREFKESYNSDNFAIESPGIHLDYSFYDSLLRFRSNYGKNCRDQMKYYCESNIKGTKKVYIPLFQGEKNSNYRAYSDNIYSINARSDRKESGWKFLSFLLEQNIQQDSQLKGAPLNVVAEQKLNNRYKYEFENQYSIELLEEFANFNIENSEKIDFLYDVNYFKIDIETPIMEYLKDEITLEEAINKAQENVDYRLNE